MRIELTWPAWKAGALPLSYARSGSRIVPNRIWGGRGLVRSGSEGDSEGPVGVFEVEVAKGEGGLDFAAVEAGADFAEVDGEAGVGAEDVVFADELEAVVDLVACVGEEPAFEPGVAETEGGVVSVPEVVGGDGVVGAAFAGVEITGAVGFPLGAALAGSILTTDAEGKVSGIDRELVVIVLGVVAFAGEHHVGAGDVPILTQVEADHADERAVTAQQFALVGVEAKGPVGAVGAADDDHLVVGQAVGDGGADTHGSGEVEAVVGGDAKSAAGESGEGAELGERAGAGDAVGEGETGQGQKC